MRHDSPNAPVDPREQLALIVDCSSEAVYAHDLEGRIIIWNRSAELLYGLSRGEALGRPATDLVPDERRAEHDAVLRRVLGGERVEHHETDQVDGDGTRIEVSLTVSAIREAGGAPWGVSTFARDIRDRREVERELAETRRELERHAAELERSNADLEQFAYVASHDLSEPLRAISGMLELLRDECAEQLTEDAGEYVDRSVRAAARLRRLIDGLLEYSRVGRAELSVVPVDTQTLVDDIRADVRLAGPPAAAGEIRVGDLPTVAADPEHLRRVFENLIANGLKFNSSDAPQVTVSAEARPAEWAFSVEDNGIGVPPVHALRIFDVFKRLHPREAYGGAGIGLSVCRRIVERHGGAISVAPGAGGGSRFTFTVPHPEGLT